MPAMKSIFPMLFFTVLLSACYKENRLASDLEGFWEITQIYPQDTSAFGLVDSLEYLVEFLPCDDAYTANCSFALALRYAPLDSFLRVDTFKYVLKENELDPISSALQPAPDALQYNNLWRLRRFFVENLQENAFTLRRYDDATIYMTLEKLTE